MNCRNKRTSWLTNASIMFVAFFATQISAFALSPTTTDSTSWGHYVSAYGCRGFILPTNDFLKGTNELGRTISNYGSASVVFGWQTDGSKDWHHTHNMPSFGVGVSKIWVEDSKELGSPFSIFGFYRGVWGRWGSHTIRPNLEVGLAMKWNPYDENTNPYNITIGTPTTVHISFGVEYDYTIAQRFVVGVGAGLTHFSNGALRKPNKGMNVFSPTIRFAYLLEKETTPTRRLTRPHAKSNEIDITLGYGMRRASCDTIQHKDFRSPYLETKPLHVGSLQATFLHKYSAKAKYGGGISIKYDESLYTDIIPDEKGEVKYAITNSARVDIGVFATHEICIARLSIPMQLGCYLFKRKALWRLNENPLFERAGLKYSFANNLHAGVNIYAHNFSKADFIEWNVGYSFPISKNK